MPGSIIAFAHSNDRGGQAPALRLRRSFCFTVGLGPSHATRACERVSLAIVRFSCTPTIARDRPSRYGMPVRFFARARARWEKTPPLHVGRGPVPRHAWVDHSVRAFQRSRGTGPRATVAGQLLFHRRARACPSPCRDLHGKRPWAGVRFSRRSNDRGGQAPALRYSDAFFRGAPPPSP